MAISKNLKARLVWDQAALAKLHEAAQTAAEQTAYALRTEVDKAAVVPRDVGTLQNSAFIDSSKKDQGRISLVYTMPYARRLYWHPEYNFRTSENANARGEWLEPWIKGDKKEFAIRSFRVRLGLLKKKAGL